MRRKFNNILAILFLVMLGVTLVGYVFFHGDFESTVINAVVFCGLTVIQLQLEVLERMEEAEKNN